MKAVVLSRYGDATRLTRREVPRPAPGPTDVLVRVRATGVNDWDWNIIRGEFLTRLGEGLFRPRRSILGLDVAGEVIDVGSEVTRFSVGDRVFGDTSSAGFGGFAEFVATSESALTPMPPSMSFTDAAALPHAGNLATQALAAARLGPDDRLLINGAAGGVGTLAFQLASHLGVRDITGVDSEPKLDFMRQLGFARTLDYRSVDFTSMGEQFDVVIDARSTRPPAHYVRALAEGGRYVTVGGPMRRVLTIAASRGRILKKAGKSIALLFLKANLDNDQLVELAAAGVMKPRIDTTWPLAETPAAMARFGRGEHLGKIVIVQE